MAGSNKTLDTPQGREAFFLALYEMVFPVVAGYVARQGGSYDDASDIFQDALVIYYEKCVVGGTETVAGEQAYIMGIAKKLWMRHRLADRASAMGIVEDGTLEQDPQPDEKKLLDYLAKAGARCMELLRAYYYGKLTTERVAVCFGYGSKQSATVAKYKCLEKVRESIKQNALSYADFTEQH